MGLERITQIRKQKGITLEELSIISNVPVSTIKKISAGITTNPNLDTVKSIAKALQCRLDDFDDNNEISITDCTKKFANLSDEAIEVAEAYEVADSAIKTSVRKLLDIEDKQSNFGEETKAM